MIEREHGKRHRPRFGAAIAHAIPRVRKLRAQWGEVQVELIVQHDDSPSIYSEFTAAHGYGLQHVGVLTEDLDAQLDRLKPLGVTPTQWGATAAGMRFAYLNSDAHAGGMIELMERGPTLDAFFSKVRAASIGWDGSRPLRKLG